MQNEVQSLIWMLLTKFDHLTQLHYGEVWSGEAQSTLYSRYARWRGSSEGGGGTAKDQLLKLGPAVLWHAHGTALTRLNQAECQDGTRQFLLTTGTWTCWRSQA